MNKQEILNKLDKSKFYQELIPSLKVNGKSEALGLCPFHDDHNPSMNVNVETGLYHCHACDAGGDIFSFYMRVKEVDFPTALKEIGEMAGVVESDTKSKVVATFRYTDEAGKVLYIKERLEPGRNGRSKEFVFKHLEGDRWILNRGCDPVPYRLPELIKSKYAFVCEGEAKADLLNSWGLTATCLDSGSNSPIKDEYIQILRSMEKVVILPDNDTPGRAYASKIASVLHGSVGTLKVVELPGLKEAEDVIDWVRIAGNDKEKLIEIVKNVPLWTPKECNKTAGFDITKALKIGAELQTLDIPINWAVKGLVPQQAITLLSARGGMGKTILSISMSDAVSKGIPFLGLETNKMPVVYIDFENSLPTLVERVKRIDASDVLFWHPTNEIKPPRLDSKEYEFYKKLPQGALLIFDTLRASQSRDENDSQHMAMIMQRLKELRDCGYTILILHHTSKSSDRIYKGSTAIFDLCDHNLSLHKVKKGGYTPEENEGDDDTDDYCYRLGTQDKTRYEPFHTFLEFDIEKGCFVQSPDPDTETLEEIYNLIKGKEPLKTNDVYELIKKELGIKKKGKVLGLLKKGIGKYFKREQPEGGRALYYSIIVKSQSPAIYTGTMGLSQKTQSPSIGTITQQKHLETLVNTAKSQSPDHAGTMGTLPKTIVPDDSENRDTAGTIETGQNDTIETTKIDDKKEISEEILEVEYVEEISNV